MRHDVRGYLDNNGAYIPAQDVLILEMLIELLERPDRKPLDFSGLAVAVDRLNTLAGTNFSTTNREGETMSDQDILNQFVTDLGTATTALAAEIQALQAQPVGTPLDWTAANAALSTLQGLEPSAPAPSN